MAVNMFDFWLKMTQERIKNGMDKEEALAKVPAKFREQVREAIENE